MSNIRWILLSALAALTVSSVASSSALAVECKKEAGSKTFVLCIGEPLVLTVGTFKWRISGEGEYIIKTAKITIECPTLLSTTAPTITGTANSVGMKKIVWHFTECKVSAPANCEIEKGLIITLSLEGSVVKKETVLIFPEEAGNIHFATITFLGPECGIAGKQNLVTLKNNHEEGPLLNAPSLEVTGFVEKLSAPGTEATTNLKLGTAAATLKGTFKTEVLDEKEAALKWAVIEGK
jgi:hypothetical protein